jgi:hypothetical protein
LQNNSYAIGANIARLEGSLQNLTKVENQNLLDLDKAKSNYSNALEKESNNDHLSPKEKAIHLLDTITELL